MPMRRIERLRIGAEDRAHRSSGLEVILGIGTQAVSRTRPSSVVRLLDARQDVGELRILALCVDDAVGCDAGHAHLPCQAHQSLVALGIGCGEMMLQFEIDSDRESARERVDAPGIGKLRERDESVSCGRRGPRARRRASPLLPRICAREISSQRFAYPSSSSIREHEARTVFERQFATDDRVDPGLACRNRKPHRAIKSVTVGQCNRRKLELRGTVDQRLRDSSPLREK